ncbi:hypothetical protein QBC46DRAFT_277007 [Diplogelasinospora grovesii]|uniref:Uncharacterized protein n=1 Tax=Diplogelasinospora grovesii TaxID=303347 RepID=A0AAN6NHR4_9PEZI|nr:hypothetical protein QBC46DRAFT_277007 [Diplogelasinospora grovesii]
MTRTLVYSAALVAFIAATALTISSISSPNWISYSVSTGTSIIRDRYGLHLHCTTTTPLTPPTTSDSDGSLRSPYPGMPGCVHFPDENQCKGAEKQFCTKWRTTGFLMSFATVAELVTVVGFLVIMSGGRVKREQGGWRILGGLMGVTAGIQFFALSIVAYVFDHDDLFNVPGFRLDSSWYLCMGSAVIGILCAIGLAISAFVLPPEGGYEFLLDVDREREREALVRREGEGDEIGGQHQGV